LRAVTALLLLAPLAAAGATATAQRLDLAQLTIRERIVVRVPASKVPPTINWKTKKGPKCMSAEGLAGAALVKADRMDLIARGGKRFRVELANACPGIEFYSGFYLVPSEDRMICAGRDAIHARSGGACQIKRFRLLVPDD
jgi:hypothetical protein